MRLFADSGCDLPLAFLQDYDVTLFPLLVDLNGQTYKDMLEIRAEEVYDAIREGAFPHTYHTTYEEMYDAFLALAQSGEDGLYIAVSSALSSMYENACTICTQLQKDYPHMRLDIIDSQCASLGYGLLVDKAARMKEEHASICDIVQEIQKRANNMVQLLLVDDLRYLAKGGRLSKTGAFVGELLSIMPIFEIQQGKLIELERVRGRQKAMERLLELLAERTQNLDKQVVCVSHADDVQQAVQIKQLIERRFATRNISITMIGSAIGAHTGPNALALFSLDESYYR